MANEKSLLPIDYPVVALFSTPACAECCIVMCAYVVLLLGAASWRATDHHRLSNAASLQTSTCRRQLTAASWQYFTALVCGCSYRGGHVGRIVERVPCLRALSCRRVPSAVVWRSREHRPIELRHRGEYLSAWRAECCIVADDTTQRRERRCIVAIERCWLVRNVVC